VVNFQSVANAPKLRQSKFKVRAFFLAGSFLTLQASLEIYFFFAKDLALTQGAGMFSLRDLGVSFSQGRSNSNHQQLVVGFAARHGTSNIFGNRTICSIRK
jgi:hypothetical protein